MEGAQEQPKRRGRPAIGKRGSFTFRVTQSLRTRLEEAARDRHRSVSEEVEHRLEESFRDDLAQKLASQSVLETSFGSRKVAKVMEMIGVLSRVAQARTGTSADESAATLEVVRRGAELLLALNSALPAEHLDDAAKADIEQQAREVAALTHRIYHEPNREKLKSELPLWAKDEAGYG